LLLALGVSTVAYAQDGDITRGSQFYDAYCAACHGTDGQGRLGENLSEDFAAIDPEAFTRDVISKGVDNTSMPPWSRQYGGPLTEDQIDDIVAFVGSLSGGRSAMAPTATPIPVTPVPTVPGVSGDPSVGRTLFIANCAMCHGVAGEGVSGSDLHKAFSSIDPQQFVRATVARGIPNTAMPAWSQANGGPLTEEEIDHISSYIVTLSPTAEDQPSTGSVTEAEAESGGLPGWVLGILALIVVGVLIVVVIHFSSQGQKPAEE
jgi:mono/diheme cytochrome c family protein